MSFFYLSAVKGNMPIHLLETVVTKRLEYLKGVIKTQTNEAITYNEYVVEGSLYDIVGHYMLCIIAILVGNTEFTQFIIKAEEKLFKYRLKTLLAYDLRSFAKKLLSAIKKLHTDLNLLAPLRTLCQYLMLRDLAHHVSSVCFDNCSKYSFKVNFKHCLTFIAKRQVILNNGMAYIPCSKWKGYLILLFNSHLRNKIYETELGSLRNDPRIIEVVFKIAQEISLLNMNNSNILKSEQVDATSMWFPPCMLNIHKHLRKKHRLTHAQRFTYSLFLKDIGMSLDEAVLFWKKEYLRAPGGKSSCSHNWKENENKFVYGIRHMYGLEGSRKKYSCRNCQQIQNSSNSFSEGGCPFKSFDDDKMEQILMMHKSEPLMAHIRELKIQGKYTLACKMHLQSKFFKNSLNLNYDNVNINFTPVKYYLSITDIDSASEIAISSNATMIH